MQKCNNCNSGYMVLATCHSCAGTRKTIDGTAPCLRCTGTGTESDERECTDCGTIVKESQQGASV